MITLRHLLLALLLCLSQSLCAHAAGVTDTHINLARSTLTLVYTVPSEQLKTLKSDLSADSTTALAQSIFDGFSIHNDEQQCLSVDLKARALDSINSQQFEYTIDCHGPIKNLAIQYHLFFDSDCSHKNFARISLLQHSQNLVFTADKQSIAVPVEKLLLDWAAQRQASTPITTEQASSSHYFSVGVSR